MNVTEQIAEVNGFLDGVGGGWQQFVFYIGGAIFVIALIFLIVKVAQK